MTIVKDEYADITKNEVQRAICADEEAIKRLCANYMDNVKAYTQKERVKNKYTGESRGAQREDHALRRGEDRDPREPQGRLPPGGHELHRRPGLEGKMFDYKTNERLHRALELKLFEDQKDTIKLTSLVSNVVDKETQEKIDVVKHRLIKNYGYCEVCSTDVLHFVASIFARGDLKEAELGAPVRMRYVHGEDA